jgi:hypothetical protein
MHAYGELLIFLATHAGTGAENQTPQYHLQRLVTNSLGKKFHTVSCVIDADIHYIENSW